MKDEKSNQYDQLLTRVTLIGKAKDPNDESAWAEFTSYYRKFIYNVVRKMGLSHADAEEVVQMTLLKIWNAMPKFEYAPERGRFRSWICRIAGNTAKNYIRARGPIPIPLSSLEWDSEDMRNYSVQPEIEKLAQQEWELYLPELALKKIARNFDKRTIQVFTMLSQGKSVAEVAQKLGLATSSVYVYKQRVLNRLTAEIETLKEEL